MKLTCFLLLLSQWSTSSSYAFMSMTPRSHKRLFVSATYPGSSNRLLIPLAASGDAADDDDGFYDDYDEFITNFDPSDTIDYSSNKSYNNNNNNSSRRRGGGGGNHDYERDPSDDTSKDSSDFVATVNALIGERLDYRKTGQYHDADAIRDQLQQEYGVTVWDRERTWTTSSQQPSRNSRGNSRREKPQQKRRGGNDRDFGPNGHDYEFQPDDNTDAVDLTDIHSLIAQRLQCKLNRQFSKADAIQEELYSDYNVEVHDGFKVFRFRSSNDADTSRQDWSSSNGQQRRQSPRGERTVREYTMRGTFPSENNDDGGDALERIQDLVQQRSIAKSKREYDVADQLRYTLEDEYNVVIDDRSGEWSLRSQQYQLVGSTGTSAVSAELLLQIQQQLADRMDAKKNKDFGTADDIRDDLYARYGVQIDDRQKEFTMTPLDATMTTNIDNNEEEDFMENDEEDEEVDSNEMTLLDRSDLEQMTIPILKEKLRAKKLPVTGRKSELIDRLLL